MKYITEGITLILFNKIYVCIEPSNIIFNQSLEVLIPILDSTVEY